MRRGITTNLPIMDTSEAFAGWGDQLEGRALENWGQQEPPPVAAPPTLKAGERVSVYWTELKAWYTGTFTSSRVEPADGGGTQRASRIVYDAVGPWANCTPQQLTYHHCLDDEQWQYV